MAQKKKREDPSNLRTIPHPPATEKKKKEQALASSFVFFAKSESDTFWNTSVILLLNPSDVFSVSVYTPASQPTASQKTMKENKNNKSEGNKLCQT